MGILRKSLVALGGAVIGTVAFAGAASATWSITAVDPATGEIGAGLATCVAPAQFGGIDHPLDNFAVSPGKGIAVAQAFSNLTAVPVMAAQLDAGGTPKQAIDAVANPGFDQWLSWRQYGASAFSGSGAAYTGTSAMAWAGSKTGATYSVQGNILVSAAVVDDAERAFNATRGSLEYRLSQALRAGAAAGGDSRCGAPTALIAQVVVYQPGDSVANPHFIDFESAVSGTSKNPVNVMADRIAAQVGADTERPSAPTGLKVTRQSATSATLTWGASQDNIGVAGYTITDLSSGQTWSSATDRSTLTGLDPAHSYRFYVKAFDVAGNTSWRSNYASLAAQNVDTERPSVPTGLRLDARAGSTASLRWNASTDNVGVVRYIIFDANSAASWTATTTSATLNGLDPAATYNFFVKAQDAAGNTSWRSNIVLASADGIDTERPSTPRGLRFTNYSGTSVTLAWTGSTDNVGVVRYVISDATSGATWTSTSVSTMLSNLDPTATYALSVKAHDAAGNISWRSNTVTVGP